MSDVSNTRQDRLSKLNQIKDLGINPFVSKVKFSRTSIQNALESEGKSVSVAGRLMGWRGHGNLVFADVVDETGKIQLCLLCFERKKESIGRKF